MRDVLSTLWAEAPGPRRPAPGASHVRTMHTTGKASCPRSSSCHTPGPGLIDSDLIIQFISAALADSAGWKALGEARLWGADLWQRIVERWGLGHAPLLLRVLGFGSRLCRSQPYDLGGCFSVLSLGFPVC